MTNEQAQTSEGDGKNTATSAGTQTGATATGNTDGTTPKPTGTRTAEAKTFTQEEIDRIVQTRLNAQRAQFDKQKADEKLAADGEWQKLAEAKDARVKELEGELTKKERDLLATRIAAKHQLPETLAVRLQGDDADTLEADAVELAKLIAVPPAATSPPSSGSPANGARPNSGSPITRDDLKKMTPQQIIEAKDSGKLKHLLEGQPR
jgi:hypothetical protein